MDDAAGRNGSPNERKKAVCGDIADAAKADAANATAALLGRHRDNGLVRSAPATLTLLRAADISFVNLDVAGQQLSPRSDHRAA